jgi:hypothetical protein
MPEVSQQQVFPPIGCNQYPRSGIHDLGEFASRHESSEAMIALLGVVDTRAFVDTGYPRRAGPIGWWGDRKVRRQGDVASHDGGRNASSFGLSLC